MNGMDVKTLIAEAGGVRPQAHRLRVKPQTVYDWLRTGYIPGRRLIQIATEMALPVEVLAQLVKPSPVRQEQAA